MDDGDPRPQSQGMGKWGQLERLCRPRYPTIQMYKTIAEKIGPAFVSESLDIPPLPPRAMGGGVVRWRHLSPGPDAVIGVADADVHVAGAGAQQHLPGCAGGGG